MEAFERLATWTAWLEATGHSAKTTRDYRYWMIRYVADTLADPWDATEDDLVGYLARLPRYGASRRDWLKAVKSYWQWARPRAGRDPTERLHIRRAAGLDPPTGLLSRSELRAILRAAFRREKRRGWAILLCATTGLRIGSLVAIRAEDCHGDWLWTRAAKGGRRYRVMLSKPAQLAVRHLAAMEDATLLGVEREMFRRWLRTAAKDAGIERRVYPHMLRHAFGTQLARVADPDTWRLAMGHADLSNYPRYVHTDGDRVRSAVERVKI